MKRIVSIGLLAGGIALIVFGINASNSVNSEISRVFTGSPTDKAMYMLVGGIVLTVIGLFGAFRGSKA